MPILEYKCGFCHKITEYLSRNQDDRPIQIDCRECGLPQGAIFEKIPSAISFPGSKKAWSGRNAVNFDTDNAHDAMKKQLKALANSNKLGRTELKMPRKNYKQLINSLEKAVKNMKPEMIG